MKKAQGISLNTVIIAAIALLVLVIVAFIFMGGMGKFTKNKSDCAQYSGSCDYGLTCPSGWTRHPTAVCYYGNEVDNSNACCVRIE